MFKIDSEKDLIAWFERLETFCQTSILKKKELWFHNQISLQDIEELKGFKRNVTHALWAIYTIVIGVIAKLIFWK